MRKQLACVAVIVLFVLTALVWAQGRIYYFNNVPYRFPTVQGGSGELLTNNGSGTLTWSPAPTPEGLWAGSVVLSTVSCPAGWTEDASGRYLASRPSGGTVSGTVGTALTDLENRDHLHAGPSHQHVAGTLAAAAHTHSFGSHTTSTSGSHTHTGTTNDTSNNVSVSTTPPDFTSVTNQNHTHAFTTNSDGSHTHTIGPNDTSSVAPAVTGTTAAAGTANTGGASTTVAPRKQFIVCVKS